jgi:hypothetical protein
LFCGVQDGKFLPGGPVPMGRKAPGEMALKKLFAFSVAERFYHGRQIVALCVTNVKAAFGVIETGILPQRCKSFEIFTSF